MYSNDPSTPGSNSLPSTVPVDVLLEQQFKLAQLQQLQQLQSQIFQQQIALISGQPPAAFHDPAQDLSILRANSVPMSGLPTPSSSTELRPQPSSDYVSPMALHYIDDPQNPYQSDAMSHYYPVRNVMSAPSSMAFPNSTLPLPSDLDFDISPLTSPWLGAHQQSIAPPISNPSSSGKRAASPSSDDIFSQPPSKKHSPVINPIISTAPAITTTTTATNSRRHSRTVKSGLSTPSTSRIDGTPAAADSPSPVDILMPPPASPMLHSPSSLDSQLGGFTPVTPSTIMNLGRLGTNKVPSSTGSGTDPKHSSRPKASSETRTRLTRRASATSPNLNAIHPATRKSSPTSVLDGTTTTAEMTMGAAPVQVRKTSHKAAEQKRRDSLKTTFDDLRGLLPPIPLPSDENYPDERIPPGALPPRGPPKAGTEGPNKAVSKLQLLLCGNDFIRHLKSRVERRDEEIARLRREIARLRLILADPNVNGDYRAIENEELDLERDLDAVENLNGGSVLSMRRSTSVLGDEETEEDMGDI